VARHCMGKQELPVVHARRQEHAGRHRQAPRLRSCGRGHHVLAATSARRGGSNVGAGLNQDRLSVCTNSQNLSDRAHKNRRLKPCEHYGVTLRTGRSAEIMNSRVYNS
jgi:hypothetical protein